MRTNGEVERDAKILAALRGIEDALKAIAATLAEINAKAERESENEENAK